MSMKEMRPLGSRVLIKRLSKPTSKGGIILPDTAQEKPKQGEVICVGPGKRDDEGNLTPCQVRVGEIVLFSSYAGHEVKSDEADAEYLILSEDDILGVISEV